MADGEIVKPKLTLKQQLFINAYVGEARGNATEAARIAGYDGNAVTLSAVGYENLRKPQILDEVNRILESRTLTAPQVLDRLSEHANGTLKPFVYMSGDNAVIDLSTEDAQKYLHLLKRVKTKRRTGGKPDDRWEEVETDITLHDAQSALKTLGQYHRLWGGSGTEINIDNRSLTISGEEKAERLQQILANARERRLSAPTSVEVHDDRD